MPLLRFPLTTGTAGVDAFTVQGANAYLGRAGNDTFTSFRGSFDGLAMGGRGDDTYVLHDSTELLVYERGASPNDRLVMHNINLTTFRDFNTFYATIDGRHLFMGMGLGNAGAQSVVILDWRAADNIIETFSFNNGSFSWAQVNATVFGVNYAGNFTWEQLQSTGAFPYSTADVNEGLAFYASLDPINVAPVATPTLAAQTVPVGSTVTASTLFSVTDADGDAMTQYQFYDGGSGGGFFRVNGVAQGASQNIDVLPGDLSGTVYVAGPAQGSETLWVRAHDGFVWSEWKSWTQTTQRVTNLGAPQIGGPATRNSEVQQWHRLSDFLTLSDADGDRPVRFELTDANMASGSGRLWFNGNYLTAGSAVIVNTSDLSQLWVQGGTNTGTDLIAIRADDGFAWGDAASFDLVTRLPNRAPVVTPTAAIQGVGIGNTVAASTLFSVSDADGDTMALYRFYDGGAGGGRFRVNGVDQAANQNITVDAVGLSNTVYAAGGVQGSETLWVQVYDGTAWSEWKSWTGQTQRTSNAGTPVIGGPALRNSELNQWHRLSDFLTVTDADGDRPVRFEITDGNAATGSGRLWFNGSYLAAGAPVTLNTSELSQVWVQGGSNTGTDAITLRADDGFAWGDSASFNLVTRLPNRAPVVTPTSATQSVGVGNTVAASTLFSVTDVDGDLITQYRFWDGGAGGGQFRVNGVGQAANQSITVDASQLSNTVYAAGGTPGSETLWVQVYDGMVWSEWKSWTQQSQRTVNLGAPVIGGPALRNSELNQWHRLSDFLTVTDADGDRPVRFEITDGNSGSGSGRVWFNGGYLAQGSTMILSTSDLSQVWVQGGSNTGTDAITLRADDGFAWGDSASFNLVTRLPNRAPVVTPTSATQSVGVGNTVAASTLFSVTDADGDAMTQYRFYDGGAGGGQFRVNGVGQAANQSITVGAADLANTVYAAGGTQGSETLWVQVYDGMVWSEWKSWTEQTQRTSNELPVLNAPATRNIDLNAWVRLSDFITVTDADGDAIVRYELSDANPGAGSAYLWHNGANLPLGAPVQVNTGDLSQIWVRGGSVTGSDTITLRAHDGYGYGNTVSIDLVTRQPNRAPEVAPAAGMQRVSAGLTVQASSLFSVADADGDSIMQYRFWDSGAGGGQFRVNGVAQGANQNITIDASQLASTIYAAGGAPGSETVYVQAYDGTAWGEWRSWQMDTYQGFRLTEVHGTGVADTFTAASNQIYLGGRGADTFNAGAIATGDNADAVVMGGLGGDAYVVGYQTGYSVFENGNSAGDSLTMISFGFNVPYSLAGLIEGRHLVLVNTNARSAVVVFDWTLPQNRIEQFVLGSGNYSYDQFSQTLLEQLVVPFSWSDFDESAAQIDEMLSFYAIRESQLGFASLAANHAPTVTAGSLTVFQNNSFDARQVFSVVDADGDALPNIQVRVPQGFVGFGSANSVTGTNPWIYDTSNLHGLGFQAGAAPGDHVLAARAFDGLVWSEWVDATVTVAPRPADGAGNTPQTGRSLSLGPATQIYHDWLGGDDSLDYYRFSLSGPAVVNLDISGLANGTGFFVWLRHQDHTDVPGYPYTYANPELSTRFDLVSGDYVLQVSTMQGATFYDIAFSAQPVPTIDAAGNSFASAQALSLDPAPRRFVDWVGSFDPVDYYGFTMDGSETLMVGLDGLEPGVGVQLRLVNAQNQEVASAMDVSSGPFAYVSGSLPQGQYYLSVHSTAGATTPYSLTLNAGAPPDAAGSSSGSARAVVLSSSPQAFHDWVGWGDVSDAYRFTLTAPQTVHFQLSGMSRPITVLPFTLSDDGGGNYSNGGHMPGPLGSGTLAPTSGLSADFALAPGTYQFVLSLAADPGSFYDLTLSAS